MADKAKPENGRQPEHSDTQSGSGAAETARLRDRIDRGGTGDKVAFSDPAAAPLGTDDEAAGNSPTREEVAKALDAETARAPAADRKQSPGDLQGKPDRRTKVLVALVIVICALALVVLFSF